MERFSSSNCEFATAVARLSIARRKDQMRRNPWVLFHSLSFNGRLLNLNFKFELIILTSLVASLWTRLLLLLIRSQSWILLCSCVIYLKLIIPGFLCTSRNRTVSHVLTWCWTKCITLPHKCGYVVAVLHSRSLRGSGRLLWSRQRSLLGACIYLVWWLLRIHPLIVVFLLRNCGIWWLAISLYMLVRLLNYLRLLIR